VNKIYIILICEKKPGKYVEEGHVIIFIYFFALLTGLWSW